MKTPPHSLDAERAVLGSIVLDPRSIDEVELDPMRFYSQHHRVIASALLTMIARGMHPDVVTVHEHLVDTGMLEAAGGIRYVAALTSIGSAVNIGYYHRIVVECAARRALIHECEMTAAGAYTDIEDMDAYVAEHEVRVAQATDASAAKGPARAGADAHERLARLVRINDGEEEPIQGVTTGIVALDRMLGGLQPYLTLVAGRTAMGKTSLAVGIALAAAQSGVPVLFASVEMTKTGIEDRLISALSRAPLRQVDGREPSGGNLTAIAKATHELARLPILIDDDARLTPARLRSLTRRAIRTDGVGLVVVDYVQKMKSDNPKLTGPGRIEQISGAVSDIAKECEVPIVGLAQINRGGEGKPTKGQGGEIVVAPPALSDLKGSGALEEDAFAAVLIHRPGYYDPECDPGHADLIVAKNRNGECGRVEARWHGECAHYADPSGRWRVLRGGRTS